MGDSVEIERDSRGRISWPFTRTLVGDVITFPAELAARAQKAAHVCGHQTGRLFATKFLEDGQLRVECLEHVPPVVKARKRKQTECAVCGAICATNTQSYCSYLCKGEGARQVHAAKLFRQREEEERKARINKNRAERIKGLLDVGKQNEQAYLANLSAALPALSKSGVAKGDDLARKALGEGDER